MEEETITLLNCQTINNIISNFKTTLTKTLTEGTKSLNFNDIMTITEAVDVFQKTNDKLNQLQTIIAKNQANKNSPNKNSTNEKH